MTVKKINVAGFRGLLAQLSLDLNGNSAVIYGRNGTGKSSITDAWEWFHQGDISHLQREGARYDAYPHREASKGDTFVEVYFDNLNIDDCIKVEYNHNKKTKPTVIGNIEAFRNLSPHPCHIRHRDLTQFVYYTKSDKYDSLASLMGFERQVEFQKSLRKIERKLIDQVKNSNVIFNVKKDKLVNHLDCNEIEKKIIIKKVNDIIEKWDIELINEMNDIKDLINIFKEKIEKDPSAGYLKNYQTIKRMLQNINIPEDICKDLKIFKDNVINFLDKEIKISNIMLISLFEQGLSVIEILKEQKEDVNKCPLCGLEYPEDLEEHIKHELNDLTVLKSMYNKLEKEREVLKNKISKSKEISKNIEENNEVISELEEKLEFTKLNKTTNEINLIIDNYKKVIEKDTKDISIHNINKLDLSDNNLEKKLKKFKEIRLDLITRIDEQIEILKTDERRKQLISDYEWIRELILYLQEYINIKNTKEKLEKTVQDYSQIVEDYVEKNTENVENKFNEISANVAKFYNIIEKRTNGIENPSIKLIPNQNRVVVLELDFFGERTSPAYKYLSESQLNSFGLAIFLASAKKFNNNFKFLILDDIVNSFDAYKRPRVIELIKSEFSDFQLILELFKVQVAYNRDNIFTLRPLLQFLRRRIKSKLSKVHNLYTKINDLEKSTYFRNFCSHWKDPSSPITSDEVLDVLDNWEEILNIVKCPCGNFLQYDGKTFSCKCGKTKLNKA